MTAKKILLSSAIELRRKVEDHQRLLAAATEDLEFKGLLDNCPLVACPHERKLKDVIVDAIAVLEDTRKSFKSRQLEELRKKLTGVLSRHA